MPDDGEFTIPDGPAPRPVEPPAPAAAAGPAPGAFAASARDIEASGAQLAYDAAEKHYQPVILFGNAYSGKTSLLLSLLAILRTETRLDTGLFPAEPLLARDTVFGRYQADQATAFYGTKTQDFIEGTAAPKTAIDLPFFVPVRFQPRSEPPLTFAFMESNGEWYRPARGTDQLYPALRQQIEDFIAAYQGGIIFIHLLPYTQQDVRSAQPDTANDVHEVRDAGLAVNGAIHAYERVRTDKKNDVHLMLVTKWDAHEPGRDRLEVLDEDDAEQVEAFARHRYDQAVTSLRGMGLAPGQVLLNSYCAGLMGKGVVVALRRDNELRDVVNRYPISLWRWLYRIGSRNAGLAAGDPFPPPPRKAWWERLLDRFI